METNLKYKGVGIKVLYALTISILILGVRILLSWSYSSRIIGVCMIVLSLSILYFSYLKERKDAAYTSPINIKNICLGLLLILIDVSYNLYAGDEFRYFDYGMLTAGLFIILLNLGLLRFLKLDELMISFTTYFLFIFLLLYGFLFTGIPFLLNSPENFLFTLFTKTGVEISAFFLRFINPNVILSGETINFDGFIVSIGYACSGVESISVFLSAVIAYFMATREKKIKKIGLYSLVGAMALYSMNILRIMAIVLAGYHFGTEAMFFVHLHLGWIFFILAMAVFWYLVFRSE